MVPGADVAIWKVRPRGDKEQVFGGLLHVISADHKTDLPGQDRNLPLEQVLVEPVDHPFSHIGRFWIKSIEDRSSE
jgi:hypothetical protein